MLSATEYAELQAGFGRTAPDAMALRLEDLSSLHGDDARIWFLLGAARHRLGKLESALEAFDRTLSLAPAHLQALNAKSGLLAAQNRMQEALELLEQAHAQYPRDTNLLVNLGYLHEQVPSGARRALDLYDAALALDPAHRAALMNRGYLLTLMGRLPEAMENNRLLVAFHPQIAVAHYNLGETLLALRAYEEVLQVSDRVLGLDPVSAKAHLQRALALAAMCRLDEASASLHKVRELEPAVLDDFIERLYKDSCQVFPELDARSLCLFMQYHAIEDCDWSRWNEFVATFERLILEASATARPIRDSGLPFLSLAFPISREACTLLARGIGAALREREAARVPNHTKRPGPEKRERLRIGYVSADFRRHPGGYLTRTMFHLHDRSRFEVFGYALDPDDGSDVRRDIRAGCDVFRETHGMTLDEVFKCIMDDGLDIAVDRSGFTRMTRPEIFARRVAPLQVSYLGFPGTLGADYMDYAIVDRVVCPEGEDRWWSEQLVRMPDSYFLTNNRQAVDPQTSSRPDLGLPQDAFVFCCFNSSYKIDPQTFGVWMRILSRVPDSVLWLYASRTAVEDNLRREAQARGVDPRRLVFAPFIARHEQHLARHRAADVFLDTRYYNAHTTAADALWCGVPVLTVPGDTMPSRVAASLLKAAGLGDLVFADWQTYEDTAVRLATHSTQLTRLRQRVSRCREDSALFDSERFVGRLEAAFEQMWRRHSAGLAPAAFDVPVF
jgi:protein O-GlcNAc transferase